MAKRGNDILQTYADRMRAEKNLQPVTTRCSHCAWTLEGLLGDSHQAFALHLSSEHPDVKPPRHRTKRATLTRVSPKTLDENVAAARSQGASRWAETL
jgi:hypothetical protein